MYYYLTLYSNTITPLLTIILMFFLIIILVIFPNFLKISIKNYFNNFKVIFMLLLLCSLLCFLIKFIVSFFINNTTYITNYVYSQQFNYCYLIPANNVFSDIIIILCIVTTFISWIYLSERYLFFNYFSVIYFFIFIVFTANMVYTNNLMTMFIFFEFIFLPSLYFVYYLGYAKKVDKTIKYLLVWTLSGSFLVLCSILYLYSITKTLLISNYMWIQFSEFEKNLLFLGFMVGFGVKLPLWPFHYWLTKVHVEAPTGFSIFLSGYLVKTAFFCLSYFIYYFMTTTLHYVFLTIIFWGAIDASIRMWTATDIKRLIAFATIQEMNLIVGLLLLLNNSYLTILNLFLLVHGVLSAFLFFLVDQVQKRYQTRNLVTLSGLAYKFPVLHKIIWFSILIFRGFPLFVKFFIEWELLSLLIVNFNMIGFFVFVLITVYGVIGFSRIWLSILYGQPSIELTKSTDIIKVDLYVAYMLVIILFVLSFCIYLFNGWCFVL